MKNLLILLTVALLAVSCDKPEDPVKIYYTHIELINKDTIIYRNAEYIKPTNLIYQPVISTDTFIICPVTSTILLDSARNFSLQFWGSYRYCSELEPISLKSGRDTIRVLKDTVYTYRWYIYPNYVVMKVTDFDKSYIDTFFCGNYIHLNTIIYEEIGLQYLKEDLFSIIDVIDYPFKKKPWLDYSYSLVYSNEKYKIYIVDQVPIEVYPLDSVKLVYYFKLNN